MAGQNAPQTKNNAAVSSATRDASQSTTRRKQPASTQHTAKIQEIVDDEEEEDKEFDEDEDDEEDDSDSDSDASDSDIDDIPGIAPHLLNGKSFPTRENYARKVSSQVSLTDRHNISMINSIEPEKWKIITESGIIDQVKANDKHKRRQKQVQKEADRDYIFEGIFFSIPTTCLFVVMDVLVHRQFGEAYGGSDIFHKVIKIFPGNLFVFLLLHMHVPHFVFTGHVHKSK